MKEIINKEIGRKIARKHDISTYTRAAWNFIRKHDLYINVLTCGLIRLAPFFCIYKLNWIFLSIKLDYTAYNMPFHHILNNEIGKY
jgi:hypothetical protein